MLRKLSCCLAVLIASSLLGACASRGPIGEDPSVAVAELASLPTPMAQDYTRTTQAEVARPHDVLSVAVFGVPELTRTVRVGQGGFFEFPLIGAVQANDRSLPEIAFELESRLRDSYLREPDVTVEFETREGQVFTVGGEVGQAGQHAIIQPTTLMEAIAIAGGLSNFAKREEVLIFREIDGQRYIGVYNLKAIQRGNYPDPEIYANDLIMVGDSPSRRLIADILSYTQALTSPLILLDRADRAAR